MTATSARPEPPRGPELGATRRHLTIVLAAITALALVGVVALVPSEPPATRTSTVEDGGLAWDDVVVREVDDQSTLTARVELDGRAFPVARDADDRFVLYQLGDGRFDTDRHSDDRDAERVLGIDAGESLTIVPTSHAAASDAAAWPRSGEFSISLDGTIEYRDVPEGDWPLRAIVLEADGRWDGAVATRVVHVG